MTEEAAQKLWSVTTLISHGVPKPALVGWAAKVTADYAVDKRDSWLPLAESDPNAAKKVLKDARFDTTEKASARGTELHNVAELIALGTDVDVSPAIEPYAAQFRQFLADHEPEYLLAEAPIYNSTIGYAGTLDGIVKIRGRTFVLDIKTTDKPPSVRSRPPYPEVALQLVAYARSEVVGLTAAERTTGRDSRFYVYDPDAPSEPTPKVDGAMALMVSPYDYRLVPVRIDDAIWSTFLSVREVALWSLEGSKAALGKPVGLPARAAA